VQKRRDPVRVAQRADQRAIADVADLQRHPRQRLQALDRPPIGLAVRRRRRPAPTRGSRQIVEDHDLPSRLDRRPHKVRTDKAYASGDEQAHG
jgi:hypothetical protein